MVDKYINKWLGLVILVVIGAALLPTVFDYIANISGITGLPSGLGTLFTVLLPLIVAIGFFYALYKNAGGHGRG